MSVLKIRDKNGKWTFIPSIKGDKGDKGEDAITDQNYDPKSENAQSGKAVAEAVAPYEYLKKDEGGYTHLDFLEVNYSAYIKQDLCVFGNIYYECEEPQEDTALVNKQYVDNAIVQSIGDLETVLDHILSIQNGLIGGENV